MLQPSSIAIDSAMPSFQPRWLGDGERIPRLPQMFSREAKAEREIESIGGIGEPFAGLDLESDLTHC
jgi:hypothetical protein